MEFLAFCPICRGLGLLQLQISSPRFQISSHMAQRKLDCWTSECLCLRGPLFQPEQISLDRFLSVLSVDRRPSRSQNPFLSMPKGRLTLALALFSISVPVVRHSQEGRPTRVHGLSHSGLISMPSPNSIAVGKTFPGASLIWVSTRLWIY